MDEDPFPIPLADRMTMERQSVAIRLVVSYLLCIEQTCNAPAQWGSVERSPAEQADPFGRNSAPSERGLTDQTAAAFRYVT